MRDGPEGAELVRRPVILYGRNAVHEALRAGRAAACTGLGDGAGGARALAAARRDVEVVGADELEQRARLGRPPGRLRRGRRRIPYADAAELLGAPDPLIVALDEVQDPQNLGAICRTAECAGATGVVLPERRSAEVTPAVAKASAGAVEHLPIARVRNLADFLAEAKRAGCWCYGAAGGRGRSLRRARLRAAGSCSSWARRAGACARAWRRRATRWSRCRCAAASSRSTSARRRGGPAVRDLAAAPRGLTAAP